MRYFSRLYHRFETYIAAVFLTGLVLLPVASILGRKVFQLPGIAGVEAYMSHLLVFIALSAGVCVSRAKRNLSIQLLSASCLKLRRPLTWLQECWQLIILVLMFAATVSFFLTLNVGANDSVGDLPQWLMQLPLVLAIGSLLGYKLVELSVQGKISVLVVGLLGLLLAQVPLLRSIDLLAQFFHLPNSVILPNWSDTLTLWLEPIWIPAIIITLVMAVFGLPIYLVLAGVSLFSFIYSEGFPEVVINDFYALFSENTILQSLPLFAFAGFILSEGRSANRLVAFLNLVIGRIHGGVAIMAILLSAFFTTLTGASGVTILALGGLFAIILEKSGYPRSFSLGLLTACGSIGLLFPPSLPIIMYSVQAGISIQSMFIAGLLPGLLLLLVMIVMALHQSNKIDYQRNKEIEFSWLLLWHNFRLASGELIFPIFLIVGIFFLGITLVEVSAISVLYALLLAIIHRDYTRSSFVKMLTNYLEVIGGILLVIGFARGLADYLALHDVPTRAASWVEASIHNRWLFLLLLNGLLLLTGALMDIYSAIIVVAPLVIAMGEKYQIAPEQLGVIFLSNLELGYMTPPIGMSLFLAHYRFNVPMVSLYRYVIPFLLLMLVAVLLITYLPWLSTGLLGLIPK